MPSPPLSIKARALRWLAQREHSRVELRSRLLQLLSRRQRGPADGASVFRQGLASVADEGEGEPYRTDSPAPDPKIEVEAILLWLEALGYLSQQRFAESRITARQGRFGNLRIRQELQQHGVRLDADAMHALQATEEQRAREVWRKKYGQSVGAVIDTAARARQVRFLSGRGFSPEIVRSVVLAGGRGPDDDG